jgi:hypothetical protein
MHSRTSNTPAAVGPGFGAGSYRQNEQQQQQQQQQPQQQRGMFSSSCFHSCILIVGQVAPM